MGGSASKIAASVMLGGCESDWIQAEPRRVAAGFRGSPQEFARSTKGCRYVDDVLVAIVGSSVRIASVKCATRCTSLLSRWVQNLRSSKS